MRRQASPLTLVGSDFFLKVIVRSLAEDKGGRSDERLMHSLVSEMGWDEKV